jgi:hypothetical protein
MATYHLYEDVQHPFNLNTEHLAKVLAEKYRKGMYERHRFSFPPEDHEPGKCSCEECDKKMSEIVQVHGKIVNFNQ